MVTDLGPIAYIEFCESCGAMNVQLHNLMLSSGEILLLCDVCYDKILEEGDIAIDHEYD